MTFVLVRLQGIGGLFNPWDECHSSSTSYGRPTPFASHTLFASPSSHNKSPEMTGPKIAIVIYTMYGHVAKRE